MSNEWQLEGDEIWFKTFWPDQEPKTIEINKKWPNQEPKSIELFEEQRAQYGEVYSMWFLDTQMTYNEAGKYVDKLATAIHNLGLKKGDFVVLLLPNSFQYNISYYACAKIGVKTGAVNPDFTAYEIKDYIETNDAKAIIILDNLYSKLIKPIIGKTNIQFIISTNLIDLAPNISGLTKSLGKLLGKIPKETVDFNPTYHFMDLLNRPIDLPNTNLNKSRVSNLKDNPPASRVYEDSTHISKIKSNESIDLLKDLKECVICGTSLTNDFISCPVCKKENPFSKTHPFQYKDPLSEMFKGLNSKIKDIRRIQAEQRRKKNMQMLRMAQGALESLDNIQEMGKNIKGAFSDGVFDFGEMMSIASDAVDIYSNITGKGKNLSMALDGVSGVADGVFGILEDGFDLEDLSHFLNGGPKAIAGLTGNVDAFENVKNFQDGYTQAQIGFQMGDFYAFQKGTKQMQEASFQPDNDPRRRNTPKKDISKNVINSVEGLDGPEGTRSVQSKIQDLNINKGFMGIMEDMMKMTHLEESGLEVPNSQKSEGIFGKIEKLKELCDSGAITKQEFENKKKELLDKI